MSELYSYDKVGEYNVIVEKIDTDSYEGIAYIHAMQNPPYVWDSSNPEKAREKAMEWAAAQEVLMRVEE